MSYISDLIEKATKEIVALDNNEAVTEALDLLEQSETVLRAHNTAVPRLAEDNIRLRAEVERLGGTP